MRNVAYFNARFLEPICRFIGGPNEIRYYLKGFRIEPAAAGGVLLIATNGHVLIVARDPEGWVQEEMTVKPNKALIAAAKRKGMGKVVIQAEDDGFAYGLAFVLPGKIGKGKRPFPVDHETEAKWIAEPLTAVEHVSACEFIQYDNGKTTWTDWRRVIPQVEEKGETGYCDAVVNSGYMALFEGIFDDMMDLAGMRRLGGIRIQPFSRNGTIAVRPASEGLDALGLVMPMNADRFAFDPQWMAAPTPKPEKRRIRIRAGESAPLEAAE